MENLKAAAADVGADGMHCAFHPYHAGGGGGGGICAFCLQEKLGELVSSSQSFPSHRDSSPSPSPSFRSNDVGPSALPFASSSMPRQAHGAHHAKHSKVASFLAKKKKKEAVAEEGKEEEAPSAVFQRSRSIAFSAATPQSCHFYDGGHVYSPRKRGGFWSFISLSSSSRPHNARDRDSGHSLSRTGQVVVEEDNVAVVAANSGVSASSYENNNKVSRSRSVGCGSRSFSGDFFERISTGFIGDCTALRRVESHREGKPPRASTSTATSEAHHHHHPHYPHQCMKERVRCGGIFGGFAIANAANSSSSISSSSASSSSYWVPSSSNSAEDNVNHIGASSKPAVYPHHHGRSRSWGWALASPMRAFGRPSSSGKRNAGAAVKPASGMNGASILAVGG
ncbi:uncharacterized protein LOC120286916 [Eucalyptus grandis]|uniref:uncharacterized protein LOC120286916 n=1 Tax=Eucalyptus grandis TaxID=71139 RepID=UPI00192EA3F8|nr:uncharacterized protein LOC120286916 [Eucalyptus grandis]